MAAYTMDDLAAIKQAIATGELSIDCSPRQRG